MSAFKMTLRGIGFDMAGKVIVTVENIIDRSGQEETVVCQFLPGRQVEDMPGGNFAVSRIQAAGSVILCFECDAFRQYKGQVRIGKSQVVVSKVALFRHTDILADAYEICCQVAP